MLNVMLLLAALTVQPFVSEVPLKPDEYWWGTEWNPLVVSSAGRYVWSEKPFSHTVTNGCLRLVSSFERLAPVEAGSTLREAYLDAAAKHFAFDGRLPAELLFTKPQWNNWIEIAIQGMNQRSVDAYTEALAKSGFPCGVYMMDGGWFDHQGSYRFDHRLFPDPKGMFRRVREKGWKPMIWTAHFVSPDSREFKRLRYGRGYRVDGLDLLAYHKPCGTPSCRAARAGKRPGVLWWWSGVSCTWDLTHPPAWRNYAETLQAFAAEYGVEGFKFDAGDAGALEASLRFHDPAKDAQDFVHEYVRVGAERFPYNEYRVGWKNGGFPVMMRLPDQKHSWKALAGISARVQAYGLSGHPYVVADMIGGGEATTFRPGSYFSEKLFVRSAALQALHPMMQFSAAPWRYLSPSGVEACRGFAELHVRFAPYILDLARHAAESGEPIVRTMEYAFPHQGFARALSQFMLGPRWLVAPVVREGDSVTVELPTGRWRDDLGVVHEGPATLELRDVPLTRLPRYERL